MLNQAEFDSTVGRLDRVLSELMLFSKYDGGQLDSANLQTLKHHIEDMELCAASIRRRCGLGPNSQAQPGPVPLPPPSLGDYAAVWNGLQALTTPGNPLAALHGVSMAEFPERLGEWVAGMEEYPYAHNSALEQAVKGMLDAIAYQNDRLVGVMYEAHEKLKAAYNATPDGGVSPSLKEYANFWLAIREKLMQPGKPCHGLAQVPMAEVPGAIHDFIMFQIEEVAMANARAHGLGLLAERLTKRLGRYKREGAYGEREGAYGEREGAYGEREGAYGERVPIGYDGIHAGKFQIERVPIGPPQTMNIKLARMIGSLLVDAEATFKRHGIGTVEAERAFSALLGSIHRLLAEIGWRCVPVGPAGAQALEPTDDDGPGEEATNAKGYLGTARIYAEREKQISKGFTAERDYQVYDGSPRQLIRAALCYVSQATEGIAIGTPALWPWDAKWWKPGTPIENLTIGGALLAAAIDVIQYGNGTTTKQGG